MKTFGKFAIILSLGLSTMNAPAMAHHSFAMFDQNKIVELKDATVVQMKWGNPHVFILIESGGKRYSVECSSPSALTSSGWKFNTIKAGDKISVALYPLRDGRAGGALKAVTLANGQSLIGV